jgi:hypothetical protein
MGAPTPAAARPMGITILAVLSAIGGVLGLLGGIAIIGIGGLAAASTGSAAFFGLGAIWGLLILATAIASLVFAYGAWTLKPWAWPLGVALSIISLAIAALTIVSTGDISSQIIGIVINAVILYYLFQPNIKALFGRA